MRKIRAASLIGIVLMLGPALAAAGEETGMEPRDARFTWDLSHIYDDVDAWSAAREQLKADLEKVQSCRGRLGDSGEQLADCLDLVFGLSKELKRISAYAAMLSDQDTREPEPLAMRQQAQILATTFGQATSFVKPELLQIGAERVREMVAREPELAEYEHFLEDTLRRAPHTLSPSEENLLASAGLMADAPSTLYGILTNADIDWPTATLSDGQEVRLDQSGYTKHRADPDRADRELVFKTFWSAWKAYERTMGVALNAQVKRDLFYARARNYDSCLAAAIDGDNVPEAVYHALIDATNDNLDTLHRYLKLRQRMLGVDELRYHDLYPPLVESDLEFPIERAELLVLDALAPLGSSYTDIVRQGFDSRWMDVYPRPGKRSGAYSQGAVYDVHPYVLMNFTEEYDSVSTLAHEWGHTMHSYLANEAQPYATADYSIFMAEVASTFNEALLLEHVLDHAKSDTERLFYLGSALEGLRTTFFRQAMFAEFELRIHELVEQGEVLTGQRLTKIYGELLKRYHGHEAGVTTIDELYTIEWAYIPHFYYNFYVYQYATSIAASALLAQEVIDGKPGAVDAYLDLLKAGGSDYAYDLLEEAGADLATPAPYEALMQRMNRIMDEIEAILDRREP